ncbi:hypothetical protein PTSG_12748 [Salpingoeca rosetta]|uniref:Uncharacterized protein n=1 Tax=Salpingoeca rosetta (strain ATCC 50818 / BSB-021) TaxID=946362 RepID=F2UJX5_SALR5|nr:uncharacterized protein PTSG_12748 [Salpingoeca rosetta]EGD77424.1 hypothetical protein PTSG_12748 [Salpingoeca rosetta]|eukprot:XP_004990312.1 hypothetical protein PTSG_12748 [Salpingoeca rosetta]
MSPWHAEHPILAEVGLSEFHHRNGLGVSMPLCSLDGIHSHRSNDAFRPHKQEIPRHLQVWAPPSLLALMSCSTTSPSCTTAGTLCWCARASGLARSAWAVRGKIGYDPSCTQAEEEFNKYTCTDLALKTKFGLIIMAAGAIPSLSSTTTCWCVWMNGTWCVCVCVCVRLPRILRSIPDEVVEMMPKRVVLCLRSSSSPSPPKCTQRWSLPGSTCSAATTRGRALEPADVTPPAPTTTALMG